MNTSCELHPFPISGKVEVLTGRTDRSQGWRPTGLDKRFYLGLSEPIVRQAVAWQDSEGRLIDPFAHKEVPTATARFVGACAGLILGGRCLDLADTCACSMDRACADLSQASRNPLPGAEFYVKELMLGYAALADSVAPSRRAQWGQHLSGYDPEQAYNQTLAKCPAANIHNFCTFAIAGEMLKKQAGLTDSLDFIERYLELQEGHFTEYGMYRDPNDPMTYDWVARMNLTLLLHYGYRGRHYAFVNEMLRRGALTSLLFLSPTGEAPFGGRSNQQNHNEATLALIGEFEAARYRSAGHPFLAGAFKRAARLAARSVQRWLSPTPVRFTKNEFPPESEHGREARYGWYSPYSLLIASQFGFAGLVADDTIPEQPAPCDIGGYLLSLSGAFHKIFATCQGYHLEIDTQADSHYDATGLGRFHRAGLPTELGLSGSVTASPNYLVSVPRTPRNIAIGPGWETPSGQRHWLADYTQPSSAPELAVEQETTAQVRFKVQYRLDSGAAVLVETYDLTRTGLEITDVAPAEAAWVWVQIPLIETDGGARSAIEQTGRSFVVSYRGHRLTAECLAPEEAELTLEAFAVPNRNGIYRVGLFRAIGRQITYRLTMA